VVHVSTVADALLAYAARSGMQLRDNVDGDGDDDDDDANDVDDDGVISDAARVQIAARRRVRDAARASRSELAARLFARTALQLPALVRAWHIDCSMRDAARVSAFVRDKLSTLVVLHELGRVQLYRDAPPDSTAATPSAAEFTMRVSSTARQVTAVYELDDISVGVCMTLPLDYPLSVVSVSSVDRLGVADAQWRRWMCKRAVRACVRACVCMTLHMHSVAVTALLVGLDGSVLDALLLVCLLSDVVVVTD
jgi:hypothetical protein